MNAITEAIRAASPEGARYSCTLVAQCVGYFLRQCIAEVRRGMKAACLHPASPRGERRMQGRKSPRHPESSYHGMADNVGRAILVVVARASARSPEARRHRRGEEGIGTADCGGLASQDPSSASREIS